MWGAFEALTGWLWGTPLLVVIVVTGVYFSFRSKFFQVTKLGLILKHPFKKEKQEDGTEKRLSSFQAVAIAIGGSVGVSNISGVGTAIATGGPGALFWLWVAAFLGMIIKMCEVTLAVYYRKTLPDGTYTGGPTYYMERGLGKEKHWGKLWMPLAIIFGCGIFITFFITLQNYTVSEAVGTTFGISYIIPSVVLVLTIYAIILGGLKRVGQIAEYLVPIMCAFYVLCVVVVLAINAKEIPGAIGLIFKEAFTIDAAAGGAVGAGMAKALQLGFARSVYSNEAGWGTSPMVHARANTDHPVKQGLMGAFEVFVDTIVVCTATGILVIVTGEWSSGLLGADLTLTALEDGLSVIGIGGFARIAIALSIFLFGLTTATGWYTYYMTLLDHAFKEGKAKKVILAIYNAFTPIFGFLLTVITVVFGGTPAEIWTLADFSSIIPTFINVLVILILGKTFLALLKDYKARYLGIGKVDPDFKVFYEQKEAAEEAAAK